MTDKVELNSYDDEDNLFCYQTFSSKTLKANETITAVFTMEEGKLFVHLEWSNKDGNVVFKSKKKRWKYPIFPLEQYFGEKQE